MIVEVYDIVKVKAGDQKGRIGVVRLLKCPYPTTGVLFAVVLFSTKPTKYIIKVKYLKVVSKATELTKELYKRI